ncbi:hypothetical protein, partial [Bacillus cereus]
KKKDELAEKSTVEIASQMTGDWEKLKESQQTIAELKGEQEVVKGKMDEINTAMGKLGTSPEDDQKRKMWQATLKTLQGEYDGLGKKINSAGKE